MSINRLLNESNKNIIGNYLREFNTRISSVYNIQCNEFTAEDRKEVQGHGCTWQDEIINNVYGVSPEQLKSENVKYTDKHDLPVHLNHLDNCDVSVKTTKDNRVCMADCLRIFDSVVGIEPYHLIVIRYNQVTKKIKKLLTISEVDLTSSRELLFGTLSRCEIEHLDKVIKSVPQKRKPTREEHAKIYSLRDKFQENSGYIHLDPKVNSTQSRLQCSFNFQTFIQENISRVVLTSNTNEFKGGFISSEIVSSERVFKNKQNL
jgi:hypothetical protein